MKRALFIGRFQPFHLGHLSVVEDILQNFDEIIIAIGSSENSREDINPLSYEERKEMIQVVLQEYKIPLNRVYILAVPDIHSDNKWVAHVQNLCPEFNIVYSGSEYIQTLFRQSQVLVHEIDKKLDVDATKIRKLIQNHDSRWKTYLPKSATYFLENIHIEEILQNIEKKGEKKEDIFFASHK